MEITMEVEITDQAAIILDKLIFSMQLEGWECSAPDEQVERMDRLIVEGDEHVRGMRCKRCKDKMGYHPFNRDGEYKVWCVCMGCGERREL